MREFVVTSKAFAGYLHFGYDQDGNLISFKNDAVLTEEQLLFVKQCIPWHVDDLKNYRSKTSTVTETTDVSFDRFWKEYDYKKGKDAAMIQWKKLSAGDQVKAIVRIPAYKFDCNARNIQMIYPERYLSKKRFNDE